MINGVNRNRIARLNTDGSLDTSFLNNLAGANSHIYSVSLLTNGQSLVAGDFTVINRIAKNRFARLNADGSVDGWFLFRAAGPNDFVQSIAVQNDGKILISGDFSSVNGVSRNQVARLLTTYSPPKIDDPKMVNGQFAFFLLGSPGQTLVVQASPEPFGSTWTSLSTNFLGATPPTFIDPQSSSLTKRFYRLLKL